MPSFQEAVRSCALSGLGVALLAGCGALPTAQRAATRPTVQATPTASPTSPIVGGGGGCDCPVGDPIPGCDSPTQQLDFANPPGDKLPHTALGSGPIYWGGQSVWHTAGEQGVVLVDPAVKVPVTVTFVGPSQSDSATFVGLATLTIKPVSHQWAYASGAFFPFGAGCWTMRATYQGNIVNVRFSVVSGSPAPG